MNKKVIITSVAIIIFAIVIYGLLKTPSIPYYVETAIQHILRDNSVFPADIITGHVKEDENEIYKHVTKTADENTIDLSTMNLQQPDNDETLEVLSFDTLKRNKSTLPPVVIDEETSKKLALENKKDIIGDISEREIRNHKTKRYRRTHRTIIQPPIPSADNSKPQAGTSQAGTQQAGTPQASTQQARTLQDIKQENKNILALPSIPTNTQATNTQATKIKPIAILIDSMGENATMTKQIIDMKYNLNLSFIPYTSHVKYQVEYARKRHKTIVVQMPMQPNNPKIKLDPHALLTSDSHAILMKKIKWNLSQFAGYTAVTTYMGSSFVKNESGLNVLMDEIKRKNLNFIDALTIVNSKAYQIAIQHKIPTLKRNIFINNNHSYAQTLKDFNKITTMTNKYGYTMAIIHPSPTTIKALKTWLKTTNNQQYKLVTIKQLINHIYNVHPSHISKVILK